MAKRNVLVADKLIGHLFGIGIVNKMRGRKLSYAKCSPLGVYEAFDSVVDAYNVWGGMCLSFKCRTLSNYQ